MVFVVLEGFSGTGKTTMAKGLERNGWLRLPESAHVVPRDVPVADRADTFADYSLIGATMVYSSLISKYRDTRNIVSEGYLLSDLAYARIRYDMGKSEAYPSMLEMSKRILSEDRMQPDLYILLKARPQTIGERQLRKNEREKNLDEFFRTGYYKAIMDLHERLGQEKVETVYTDSDLKATLSSVEAVLRRNRLG
ncbi:MAG: deoxynucleoside kinase [Nitrososphaerales archaeon]|nr:deoxynucleoside kinase [Nitrososphaerales archaeon]